MQYSSYRSRYVIFLVYTCNCFLTHQFKHVLGAQNNCLIEIVLFAFLPNGISHPHQLDISISNLWVVGWYFTFYSNVNRMMLANNAEPNSICSGSALFVNVP